MLDKLVALVLVSAIVGCSTPGVTVTVTSQPDGAYITSGGPVSGIVPVAAFWEMQSLKKSSRDADGCFQLKGFTATWVSGAVTDVPVVRVCGEADGEYNFVMSRDMSHPNLEKDLQFSLQVQAVRAQNAQAAASQAAAFAAMWSAAKVGQPTQRPVHCSSYNSGSTIQTNCQ
ncbi:MAG: hypothetical protein AABZ17_05795 [Nitrospirota bacterium]